jgi:hypothetical protein
MQDLDLDPHFKKLGRFRNHGTDTGYQYQTYLTGLSNVGILEVPLHNVRLHVAVVGQQNPRKHSQYSNSH